jgi:nitrate reductase (NAD(P)H)
MQRIKDESRDPTQPRFGDPAPAAPLKDASAEKASDVVMTKPGVNRKITKAELAEHTGPENPWFVVQGEVYDATTYLNEHPGGPQSITLVAGDDATEDFMAIHSADAKRKLAEYHIGTLEGSLVEETKDAPVDDTIFLNPKQWKKSKLVSVKDVSKDSKVFRFALDKDEQALGLPTGQHVYVRLKRKTVSSVKKAADGEMVQRAYTPLSREMDKGYIDMLVK